MYVSWVGLQNRFKIQTCQCKRVRLIGWGGSASRLNPLSRLDEITRQLNSRQNSEGGAISDAPAVNSRASGPDPERFIDSAASFSGKDWLLLLDLDVNGSKRWRLGEADLSYHEVSELLNL